MENQELFDRVATHLLAQGVQCRALDGGCIFYYGYHGHRCAIGCLIPPDRYDPSFEGVVVNSRKPVAEQLRSAAGLGPENTDLARELQLVHDVDEPKHWVIALRSVAQRFGLSDAVLAR